jgi:PAS domain S-box-containing protein
MLMAFFLYQKHHNTFKMISLRTISFSSLRILNIKEKEYSKKRLCYFLFLIFFNLILTFASHSVFAQKDTSKFSNDPVVSQTEDKILRESADLQVKLLSANNKTEEQKIYKYMFLFSALFFLLAGIFGVYLLSVRIKKISVEQAQQQRELKINKLQREQLSLILDNVENSVLIASPEGTINWVNEGFKSLYGYSLADLKNAAKDNLKTFIGDEKDLAHIEKCINEKSEIGYSGETSDMFGSKIWFQRNLFPILDADKKIVSLVATDNDLTMVKLAMNEINTQKKKVEEQKNKITDSITYAGYIQQALLPAAEFSNQLFKDHFIFFKPRDIVSGDFYWFTKKGEKTIAVAADCTGHGVPGALMSVLGVSLLNEIINIDSTIPDENPAGEILNRLRDGVVDALNRPGSKKTKDGMDISLCIFDQNFKTLNFAGANNAGLILRKNHENTIEVIKLEADRMPVGIYFKDNKQFSTQTVDLLPGDRVFIFSDGYIDQFGSEKKSKFMIKRLKELLIANFDKPLSEHKEMLEKTITDWMKAGKEEQVDDMIVMGIQI